MFRRVSINNHENTDKFRLILLSKWISSIKLVAGAKISTLQNDASSRRYFRLEKGTKSFIAVDASLGGNCLAFIQIAKYLKKMNLCVPHIIETNVENNFLLVSDMGNEQYFNAFTSNPDVANTLLIDAIDSILIMQKRGISYQDNLASYDNSLLNFELELFRKWFCNKHLNLKFNKLDRKDWQECCEFLIENALGQKQVFVHRDYHSKNLMVLPKKNPGILDFQDAVKGPLTYDLVSLLKDCYIKRSPDQIRSLALYFHKNLDKNILSYLSVNQFMTNFELMGLQRHLKIAGIFCRLNYREKKSSYMQYIHITLSYIVEITKKYPELAFIDNLIRGKIMQTLAHTR